MAAPTITSATQSGNNIVLNWTHNPLSVTSDAGCPAPGRTYYVLKVNNVTSAVTQMAELASNITTYTGAPGDGNWNFIVRSRETYWWSLLGPCQAQFSNFDDTRGPFHFGNDTDPNPFPFTAVTGANASTLYTSNIQTISGMTPGVNVSITASGTGGGQYQINSGSWVTGNGTIRNGDTLRARITSAPNAGAARSITLNIGGNVSSTYTVTTASPATSIAILPASGTISMSMLRGAFGPRGTTSSALGQYRRNGTYYESAFSENTSLPAVGSTISMSNFYNRRGRITLANFAGGGATGNVANGATLTVTATQGTSIEKDLEYQWLPPVFLDGNLTIVSGGGGFSINNRSIVLNYTNGSPISVNGTLQCFVRPRGVPGFTPIQRNVTIAFTIT